jgi:hypothetical protein
MDGWPLATWTSLLGAGEALATGVFFLDSSFYSSWCLGAGFSAAFLGAALGLASFFGFSAAFFSALAGLAGAAAAFTGVLRFWPTTLSVFSGFEAAPSVFYFSYLSLNARISLL